MNSNQEVLLKLIKQSQFKTSNDVNFANVDLDELYKEASFQSVLGLVANEIPKEYLNDKWKQAIYRQIASYTLYNHAENELIKLLNNESIPFVILKGNSATINYREPSYRAMGDIDFYVLEDDFDRTRSILSNNGYIMTVHENENPRHVGYSKNKVRFELHRMFSHGDIEVDDIIKEGFKDIKRNKINDHEFPMLPKLANGIVLLEHMRIHLKSALGLRQIIDWMMYVYRNLDDEFWNNEFKGVAKEKGIDTLAIIATRMCQIYLGLPETITWCRDADENDCELLLNCLLISGNFGRKNGKGNSVETVATSIKRKGLFRWLQYAGEINWKAYHKHHWLKPLCWSYQIFRYAKKGIKANRNYNQLKNDLKRSNDRYELLKKLNIN